MPHEATVQTSVPNAGGRRARFTATSPNLTAEVREAADSNAHYCALCQLEGVQEIRRYRRLDGLENLATRNSD